MRKLVTEFMQNNRRWQFSNVLGTTALTIRCRDATTSELREWHDLTAEETRELFDHLTEMYATEEEPDDVATDDQ